MTLANSHRSGAWDEGAGRITHFKGQNAEDEDQPSRRRGLCVAAESTIVGPVIALPIMQRHRGARGCSLLNDRKGYRRSGERITEKVDQELAKLIPGEQPIENLNELLNLLHLWGCISVGIQTRRDPFHDRDFYSKLWGKSLKVDEIGVTFDAAAPCLNHWSWTLYRLLREVKDYASFNSQDVVAAILFLIVGRELTQTK